VKLAFRIALFGATLGALAYGKTEFDAASIHVNPPQAGFHLAANASSGGPGTADPGMFRCSGCTLATLITRAFELQPWQFPGRTSQTDNSFDVMAKIPAGATQEDFVAMLQNLLEERFGLTFHYVVKNVRGYHLTLAGKSAKLKVSDDSVDAADQRLARQRDSHAHGGPMIFHGSASWRRDHQTTADVARMVADQLNLPVDDQTGLEGKYDIALTWTADVVASGAHADGAWGGGGHGDHGGGGSASQPGDVSGPTLFEALQSQLGLKLVPAAQTEVRVFIVDHVQAVPAEN
jgi:uncharacterized protein (TIGR03435 family)